jgi:squalene-hopene/tetraprenyl-beta-curcumene cyclase
MNLGIAIAGAWLLIGAGDAPSEMEVRAAVERSLPFVMAEGEKWIAEKKCLTCHQVPFMVWALNAAAERGIELDRQKREECSAWAVTWKNMATKEDVEKGEEHTLARHSDPVAQLLLARGKADVRAKWAAKFAERLAAGQQGDGSWKAGGQLPAQKRPERETQEVSTMWSLVALQSYAAPAEANADRFAAARKWLGSKTEGQSTEWWAVKLLLERGSVDRGSVDRGSVDRGSVSQGGGNEAEADRLRGELVARQREDGGWGWLSADESDAFGTGVALYALARDGIGINEPAITRGRAFLMRTQQPDGSWLVNGTKKNKSKQVEPTATYWGTCWAVIGLVETVRAGE